MPEDFNFNRRLINAPDDDQSDESEEEIKHDLFQPSRRQKVRDIVQNFFNCNKFSTKKSNKETSEKKNKSAKLFANLMCQNIKQTRLDDSKIIECETDATDQSKTLSEDGESKFWFNRNNRIQAREKSMRNDWDVLKTETMNEVKNKDDSLNDLSCKGKVGALKHNQRERVIVNASHNITHRTSSNGNSGLEYDRIRESLMKENERLHELSACNVRRCSSAEVHGATSNANFLPKLKAFLQNNVRKIWKPRFHSGSVVIKNEEDTNVMFAPFESDLGQIVDKTVTSRSMSTPDLLSGGTVVFEGFADSFKTPNYYVENPLVVDFSRDTPITKSSALNPSPAEPRVLATSFSGGSAVDNSSKGVSLPDLFPPQKPTPFRPSAQQHLSGGRLVKLCDVHKNVNVDIPFHSLKIRYTSLLSSASSNQNNPSRVNSSETMNASLNESKSNPGLGNPSSNAERFRRYGNVVRWYDTDSTIHFTVPQACTSYANTDNRPTRSNSNCNNAAAKQDCTCILTWRDMARPIPTTRNVAGSSPGSSVDQGRNRRSNADGIPKTSTPNSKSRDLRGRSRYL